MVVRARPLIRMLFLAVALLTLIACANLAGLLLVRAIRRQRETAVRIALGAPSSMLLRQTVLESVVLSVIGGVLGIGLAALALRSFGTDEIATIGNAAHLERISDRVLSLHPRPGTSMRFLMWRSGAV